MPSVRSLFCMLLIVPLLTLSGCGDGWETVPYAGTPYGDRTAGTGVAYVRKAMARERGPILEPEMKPIPATPPTAKPAGEPSPADKAFKSFQKK